MTISTNWFAVVFINTFNQGLACTCEEEIPVITTSPSPPLPCDLPGVTGPTCNTCLTGYFNFSQSIGCTPCSCNINGTLDSICDSDTGLCDCAPGVLGSTCDSCPVGSIGPSRYTESPCTACYCNGFSTVCEAAEGWYQAEVVSRFSNSAERGKFKSSGEIKNDTR